MWFEHQNTPLLHYFQGFTGLFSSSELILCRFYAFLFAYKQHFYVISVIETQKERIMSQTAVIVARFQSPYLHEGHRELITQVAKAHRKVVIVLGVSPLPGTRKNPYDFHTREKLIKKDYANIVVLPLADHPSDQAWSNNLDDLLTTTFPNEDFVLYGSRDSFLPYYSGRMETTELKQNGHFNATDIRKEWSEIVGDSEEFRAGILYALNKTYKKAYPTVDVAVYRHEGTEILLGQKYNSPLWRLPGGFVDPEDECYEVAGLRELQEECGTMEVSELRYLMSSQIDDWRYRSEEDKIITTLFACDHISGEPKASDDLKEVRWFKLEKLKEMIEKGQTAPEHSKLLNRCLKGTKTLEVRH